MDKINLKPIFYFSAVLLGAFQFWNTRFYMNPDGVSYLDIGDAYFKGDFNAAINAYWSPFYSWVLGLALYLIRPNAYYEFPVVHGVNFVIYLFSIVSFHFFIKELVIFIKQKKSDKFILLPDWSIFSIGYMLFLYTTLKFITLWMTTPDLLLALFIYLIFGLILRIKNGFDSSTNFILLGALLGVSYLIKAVMFPLGFLILLSAVSKNNIKKILIASFCFILISLPFIISISNQKQRLTFGDTGTLNYVWQVNDVTPFYMTHWQGGIVGEPVHPTRKIFSSPDVYEFNGPINATYPPWFDPSYWYEGVKPDLNPCNLFRFLKNNLKEYFLIFIVFQGILIVSFLYLFLKVLDRKLFIENVKDKYSLLIPSLSAILIYALVYPELRYIAPFVITVWLVLFSSLIFKDTKETNHSFKFATNLVIIFIFLIILTAKFTPSDYSYIRELFSKSENNSSNYYVAKELKQIGIHKGDSIAIFSYGHVAFWARLGRLKIVAEMPDKEIKKFWNLNLDEQLKVFKAFKGTGAKAIVLDSEPKRLDLPWQKLGNTGYYVCFLN